MEELISIINMMEAPIGHFYEIFFIENGKIIDHTEENHRELTFTTKEEATLKALDLIEKGYEIEIWRMG